MKTKIIAGLFILLFLFIQSPSKAQVFFQEIFRNIELSVDTATFSRGQNSLYVRGSYKLSFYYQNKDTQAEIKLFPYSWLTIDSLKLLDNADFDILEDPIWINDQYFRCKVKFKNLMQSEFLNFTFQLLYRSQNTITTKLQNFEINLLPYTHTFAEIYPKSNELFIGEEKRFEITSNYPENIIVSNRWKKTEQYDYRITRNNGKVYLNVLPNRLGTIPIHIPVRLKKPFLNSSGKLSYQLPSIEYALKVKKARLIFLKSNVSVTTLNEQNRSQGIEIEINYYPGLRLNKTYRLEETENPGGSLKAEIFTRKLLNNGRVLCWLRVYNYHQRNDGYLYIKDGDRARFITNFDINPELQIAKLSILREGSDWTGNRQVSPGEKIGIKIEGTSLSRAKFRFEGLNEQVLDTALSNEKMLLFEAKVPLDIKTKQIALYNSSQQVSNFSLTVREFQRARELDFINIKTTNDESFALQNSGRQIVVHHSTKDIIINFDEDKIDQGERLFGVQYLEIDIRVMDSRNKLLDTRSIKNIKVCPGGNSPRFAFYPKKGCTGNSISLNEYLRVKVYDLFEWSTIELTVRHQSDKYRGEGYTKKIDVVFRQASTFDLEVSFPGGLLIRKIGEEGFSNFGGISMAVIAQFSFYHPSKINRLRPYRFGAGFLALNAFNFSENNTNRDVGLVALGSLYPLQKYEKQRLSFPIYLGGGYLVSEEKWFYLLGPGIRVRL